jgi:glycosidase
LGMEDGVWPRELQDPACFHRRGQIRKMDAYTREEGTLGDFFQLKDLDLKNPRTLDTLVACYKYWIAECDVDGYRLDTVTHTEPEQTAIFCNAIREYARSIGKDNFLLYAEIVAGDERLQKYIGQNTPIPGESERFPVFGACLDFPLYFVLEEVIKGFQPPTKLRERYESFRHFYRDYSEAGQYFVTFVDNHDQIGRAYRRFMAGVNDYRQAILAIGYLLTNMGIPCIYYGTEQGFDGGGKDDIYVRENMFGGAWGAFDTTGYSFFNPNHPIYQGIAKIAAIRETERTLRYGREYFREISGDGENFGHPEHGICTLAYSRVLDTTEILIALNLDENDRNDCILCDAKLNPAGSNLRDLLGDATYEVKATKDGHAYVCVPLKGRTMAILKKE